MISDCVSVKYIRKMCCLYSSKVIAHTTYKSMSFDLRGSCRQDFCRDTVVNKWVISRSYLVTGLCLQGAAMLSVALCFHQHAARALAVPTVTGGTAYIGEFINLFATPIESTWQRLEISP